MDIRIKYNEEFMIEQKKINYKITEYMEDSDSWHSSAIQHRFKGGAPTDGYVPKTGNAGQI